MYVVQLAGKSVGVGVGVMVGENVAPISYSFIPIRYVARSSSFKIILLLRLAYEINMNMYI